MGRRSCFNAIHQMSSSASRSRTPMWSRVSLHVGEFVLGRRWLVVTQRRRYTPPPDLMHDGCEVRARGPTGAARRGSHEHEAVMRCSRADDGGFGHYE